MTARRFLGAPAAFLIVAFGRANAQIMPAATPCCYVDKINSIAGAPVNLDSLYQQAVARRLALEPLIRRAGAGLFPDARSTVEVLRRMRADSQYVMRNPDSILVAYSSSLERARGILDKLFNRLPSAPLVVRAVPAEQAALAAPAGYQYADRSQGRDTATFLVNAYQPGGIARMNILFGTAHEAYPGHHFQRLYALASGQSPDVTLANSGFVEGWGIYSEQLGDEAGLYDHDAVSKLGYLIHIYDVFIALQTDIGIHARGWTHAAAVDTMMMVAGRPKSQAESYTNRHAATPGQLASYGIGLTAIVRSREAAQSAFGAKFDLRAFHDAALGGGSITLPELDRRVKAWIAKR